MNERSFIPENRPGAGRASWPPTDGISRLIIAGGIQKVTMRAIAADVGISVGTLAGHLTNRERILRVCGRRFGRRRLDALALRTVGHRLSVFLP